MEYFAFTYDKIMVNDRFAKLFGILPRKKDEKTEQIHYDIGASAQKVLEDVLLKIANHIYEKFRIKNLCLGGGVALNSVANYRILKEGPFDNIHIPPSPGDAGSAVGSAQYLYYIHNNQKRIVEKDLTKTIAENVYVGPSYSDDTIQEFLNSQNISYEKLTRELVSVFEKYQIEIIIVNDCSPDETHDLCKILTDTSSFPKTIKESLNASIDPSTSPLMIIFKSLTTPDLISLPT